MQTIQHFINQKPYEKDAKRYGDVYNPSTGEKTARVAFASQEDLNLAVEHSKRALVDWRDASLAKRVKILFAFRELLEKNKNELAALITAEHGKVLSDALGEVNRGLEVVEFACGIPQLMKGEFSENVSSEVDSYSIRQPLGVVAGITPFNFPVMVPMWMFPIALACGNTFILKPSEKDPSAAMMIADLLAKAGLPEGVFQVVHGDKDVVDGILAHPDIAAVSFVGSTPIAKYIYENGTRNGKRVQALGGAKNHMLVLPDADMELAADSAINAGYGSAGERCMAISVLLTVGDAAEKLLPKIKERLAKLKVGPGTQPSSEMGPLVTKEHRDKVASYVDKGVTEGAELLVDGRGLKIEGHASGFFLGPSLFDKVTPEMIVYQDEIFGPVLSCVRVKTYNEAVTLINENKYANGVAIFTNDGGAARKFQHEIQVGMIGINVPIPVPMAYYSFGGWKNSLFGDTHVHGKEGVHFYTRGKVITARWPDPKFRGINLGFPQNK
jgi:malonate-semialdehyde dehydrogenase (acetylating)/methylmalonate-semialdehyde dehydrogenase